MNSFLQNTSWSKNPVIYGIITINTAVYLFIYYVLQITDPSQNCFGGLHPYKIIYQGDYWRIISSMFIHYDLSHIVFNMLALLIFGSYAESFFGHMRVVIIYIFSGLFANLVALTAVTYWFDTTQYCAIGASGAILGLATATAYLMWRVWRVSHSPHAYIFARQLAIILLIQFGLDLIIKENSLLHHLSGAVGGAILAYILTFKKYYKGL